MLQLQQSRFCGALIRTDGMILVICPDGLRSEYRDAATGLTMYEYQTTQTPVPVWDLGRRASPLGSTVQPVLDGKLTLHSNVPPGHISNNVQDKSRRLLTDTDE